MSTTIGKFNKRAALVIFLTALIGLSGGCAANKPVANEAPGGQRSSGPKRIVEIVANEDATAYMVHVKGNRQLTYTSVKQNLPLGVLFYFPDTDIDTAVTAQLRPQNEVIESVEASQISEKQDMSRILVALKQDVPYDVTADGNGIRISFTKPSGSSNPAKEKLIVETQKPSVAFAPEESAEATPAEQLKGVYITKAENQTRLNIAANGAINDFKSFSLSKPARIVIDMPNLKSPYKGEQVVKADTEWVRQVRHCAYPDKVRLVIDTRPAYLKAYQVQPTPNGLLILVGSENTAEVKPAAAAKTVAEKPTTAKPSVIAPTEAKSASALKATPDSGKTAWVNRIDFVTEEAGQSTIIVGTTRPVRYELKKASEKLLQLKLYDTKLPKYRDRPLITTRFESAVNRITPVFKPSMPETTLIAIELRETVPYEVEQKDDVLLVQFEASSVPPKPLEQANLPDWKKVLAQTEAGSEAPPKAAPEFGIAPDKGISAAAAPSASPKGPPPAPVVLPAAEKPATPPPIPESMAMAVAAPKSRTLTGYGSPKHYTGEKIALDFYETDIKNVFRIIREISGKNFAIDKDVTGNVTLTLEKPVPWDQVLDLVLKMNRLGMVYEGDIIRIATLSTLTAEEKAKQEKIAAEQKSQEVVKALEPLVTEYIAVNYSDAKGEVLPLVKKVLTKDRGSVSVDQRNNQLIVTDTAAKIAQIMEIVSRIDTVTPQVIIEAKVVEVSDEFSLELGIDWQLNWEPTNVFGGNNILETNVAMNFPSAASSSVGFNFTKIGGTPFTLDATLNAVEANKQGRIITAPKIVTLDNKKAKIKQGVEWPYLERDSSGNATVKFKNIDLLLEVTPTVTPDDRILMKIFITKNDIGTLTLGVPSLNTNEAQTELLVNDGDTIVIGGIIKKNEQDSVTGWPGVKDIPLLGWMFKTENQSNTANELLIFITPRIVQLEQRRVL